MSAAEDKKFDMERVACPYKERKGRKVS